FESLIGLVAIIALFVIISRQQSRIGLIERELGALRSLVLSGVHVAPPQAKPVEQAANDSMPADAAIAAVTDIAPPSAGEAAAEEKPPTEVEATEAASGPWAAGEAAPAGPAPAQPVAATAKPAQKPDIETALGTRWAVWVGGIALALGGLFLIRYTIEAGIFGPGVRL
ncbi:MAG: DUF2339 domain-containing protein, partial [Mesorhizobium sp.]